MCWNPSWRVRSTPLPLPAAPSAVCFVSMQKGVSRGIFSNEAGLGTGSIAHACADTKKAGQAGHVRYF
ncbi:MAG: alanine:cation symporter family protein [Faecalibacterium sp.]